MWQGDLCGRVEQGTLTRPLSCLAGAFLPSLHMAQGLEIKAAGEGCVGTHRISGTVAVLAQQNPQPQVSAAPMQV